MDEQQIISQLAQAQDPNIIIQFLQQLGDNAEPFMQMLVQKAQQGDQQAAMAVQNIQAVVQQMQQQQQVRAAKFGAKLNYIKQLRGVCPEGYEMQYFKSGGQLCKRCMKKKKRMEDGGEMPSNPVDAFKCGRKMKKKACGGSLKKKEVTKAQEGIQFDLQPTRATQSNQYHADMADRYFEEARNSDGSGAWSWVKGAYHWLNSKPELFGESDVVTGMPPENIGGLGKALRAGKVAGNATTKNTSKAAKLATQTAKEDKAMGVSKKVKTENKYGQGFNDADARHVNSGQSRVQNNRRRLAEQQIADPNYYPTYSRQYNKLQVKRAKASNPEDIARIDGEIKALIDDFIDRGLVH